MEYRPTPKICILIGNAVVKDVALAAAETKASFFSTPFLLCINGHFSCTECAVDLCKCLYADSLLLTFATEVMQQSMAHAPVFHCFLEVLSLQVWAHS